MLRDEKNLFLGGRVYTAPAGNAAVIWTMEEAVYVMAILFSDEQVLLHCGARVGLFTDAEWGNLENSLGDPDALPTMSSNETLEPIVIKGNVAKMFYNRFQGYKCVTSSEEDDMEWYKRPIRIIGFLYLDSIGAQMSKEGDHTLIIAAKTESKSYRIFICHTSEQARRVLDQYENTLGFDRGHYDQQLGHAILNDDSKKEMIVLGEGESGIVAYNICLWIEVSWVYHQSRRPGDGESLIDEAVLIEN